MKNLIRNKTFTVVNLGCRVNLFESTVIIDQLVAAGCIKVDDYQQAQIVVLNTCTVTARADRKCRNFINRIKTSKKLEVFVVIGCYSQINFQYASLKADIVLGNKFKNQIPELLNQFYLDKKQIVKVEDLSTDRNFEKMGPYSFCENTRAIIKIQDGCDFMCSYCLIPYARGRQRSLKHELILNTINDLIKQGFYEIVLTGVNTAGYIDGNHSFLNLLQDINQLPGNFRVRISSIEPFQISDEIIQLVCTNPQRWCQHFHLCLQSASDEVLKSMHRKYTFSYFRELCDKIRDLNPLASITTDYIVGYCNETNKLFQESINNLDKIHLSFMNTFPYSERNKTGASHLTNVVSEKEKRERYEIVEQKSHQWTHNYLKQFIDQVVIVNFEHPKDSRIQCGHSQYFFKVNVKTGKKLQASVLPVKVTEVNLKNEVFGIIV